MNNYHVGTVESATSDTFQSTIKYLPVQRRNQEPAFDPKQTLEL